MPSALRTYAYDPIGRPYSDGSRSYSWNLADQITQISGVAAYGYDANGKRIKTTLQNGTVEYDLYDLQGQLVYSFKPALNKQTDFLNLAGKPLAELVNGIPTFLHPDLLGSPRLATSATKAIVWREHFDPYGQKLNNVNDRTGYTGHAYDSESGLTYAQARFYDPMVGRFLSTDPITFQDGDPGTFNRYAYVSDSPYDHTDPTGMVEAELEQQQQWEEHEAPTGSHIVHFGMSAALQPIKQGLQQIGGGAKNAADKAQRTMKEAASYQNRQVALHSVAAVSAGIAFAQPEAAPIAGTVSVVAEITAMADKALHTGELPSKGDIAIMAVTTVVPTSMAVSALTDVHEVNEIVNIGKEMLEMSAGILGTEAAALEAQQANHLEGPDQSPQ